LGKEGETMDDLTTTKRALCVHGAVNTLTLKTVRTDTGFTVKASQAICQECLRELGADLAKNNLVMVDTMARGLQRIP
jgi:hypothetical protein